MLKLKDNFDKAVKNESNRTRHRRFTQTILMVLLLAIVTLLTERFRGQWALKRWKAQMTAKGERFDVTSLWPSPNAAANSFSNQLAKATEIDRGKLAEFASSISSLLVNERGEFRRGSQEVQPQLAYQKNSTNTWEELDDALKQNEAAFASLRELMKNPPPTMGLDMAKQLAGDFQPNFVSVRKGAQLLQAAAMNDLHKGELSHALENLVALQAFAKLYEGDPGLVNYMIRMAIVGLTVDVCWDALQADGWTSAQLTTLQQSCAEPDKLLSQMPRTLEAERVRRIYVLRWLRSHSYKSWVNRNQPNFESFGVKPPGRDTAPTFLWWRQNIFHPLWSFTWADQEELAYLSNSQLEVTALRDAVQKRAWSSLTQQLAANQKAYRTPVATWRFYLRLPMEDIFGDQPPDPYPYPNITRAWSTTMQTLTRHEMLITAIAMKRFELQDGKKPSSLDALIPEFLAALPMDFMDGHPLRYRLNSDGTYALYSVGDNLIDDGGISIPGSARTGALKPPWNGKDWVWPAAAASKPGQIVKNEL